MGPKTPVMVSNFSSDSIRIASAHPSVNRCAIFAVLYKYWLTTPVLQYFSIPRWRSLAVVIETVCGGALSLLRV